MAARVTYRRKHTYRTKSNQVRRFRTPGGKLMLQYRNKQTKSLVCYETGALLNGIPRIAANRVSRRSRTVSRPYGGCLSAGEVRNRIKRAFLNEEMKVIKNAVTASKKSKTGKGGKKRN
jgi:large subunit ribosomal protein L34e